MRDQHREPPDQQPDRPDRRPARAGRREDGRREHDRVREPRRGRPRSEAAERAIVQAVVRLLEEGEPLAGLSIERIARTAGVGKATIYRRWPGKEDLFVDVLQAIEPDEPALSGTSGLADILVGLESMRRRGLAQRGSALLHNVFAQMKSHPKLWEAYQRTVIEPRRVEMTAAVRRAVAAGELRDDVDAQLIEELLVGPMLVRTVHRKDAPLGDDLSERILRALLEGLLPRERAAAGAPGRPDGDTGD
ncbi:TetR/AcrR family transcriptional regulator [Streptomyces sp. NBC_01498]|uniref:TetR/AcrR family transcriptional regulator n=1 Tax=Streptomyces sp. NBC_01498 TaxID=2975870 RepID=UPI003FCE87B3